MQVIYLPQQPFKSAYNRVHDISKFFSLNDISTYVINPSEMASDQLNQTMYKHIYDVTLKYSIDLETKFPFGVGVDYIESSIEKLYHKIYEIDNNIILLYNGSKWNKVIKQIQKNDELIKLKIYADNQKKIIKNVENLKIGKLVDFELFNSYITDKKTFRKVGYYGNVNYDTINFNMLHNLANNNKDFIIDIIGKIEEECKKELIKIPINVRFFGAVSRKYVGNIMKYWSAGIKFKHGIDILPYYCLGLKDIYIVNDDIELQYLLNVSQKNIDRRIKIAKRYDIKNNTVLNNLIKGINNEKR